MINDRFISYFREHFFTDKADEFTQFCLALERPLSKTIRVKPDVIKSVKKHLEKDGYILRETPLPVCFEIDRVAEFNPFERRLGYSLDHLVGNFYIQELAAAHPVHILADGVIHDEPLLILDMASSPGGKTTQLAEYFPKSFIIANEPTRERIPQLLQNLDRMGSLNIGVTLYPGQYFAREAEVFDRILLDAPCSGEGTAFRGSDVLANWHLKSVKKIAHLQEKLLESALIALKIGGEMVYSTCTLNLIENEGVILSMQEKYPDTFEILFQKKWWPHIDGTGGFFVAKLRKSHPIEPKGSGIEEKANEEINHLRDLQGLPEFRRNHQKVSYYKFRDKILATTAHPMIDTLRKKYYFMRLGEEIAKIDNGYILSSFAGRDLDMTNKQIVLPDEGALDMYLRGSPDIQVMEEGPILISYGDTIIGLDRGKNGMIENIFPRDWRRK